MIYSLCRQGSYAHQGNLKWGPYPEDWEHCGCDVALTVLVALEGLGAAHRDEIQLQALRVRRGHRAAVPQQRLTVAGDGSDLQVNTAARAGARKEGEIDMVSFMGLSVCLSVCLMKGIKSECRLGHRQARSGKSCVIV